jgi:hypothetical protein
MIDRLIETLKKADSSASNFEIDQIAFLIGRFPTGHRLYDYAKDCPRIQKLLPEMNPCRSETEALIGLSHYMSREDYVGAVAERIRKVLRPS